jgi:hypothetical protein
VLKLTRKSWIGQAVAALAAAALPMLPGRQVRAALPPPPRPSETPPRRRKRWIGHH